MRLTVSVRKDFMINPLQNVSNVDLSAVHAKRTPRIVQNVVLVGKIHLSVLWLKGISRIKRLGKLKNAKKTVRHARIKRVIAFPAFRIG